MRERMIVSSVLCRAVRALPAFFGKKKDLLV